MRTLLRRQNYREDHVQKPTTSGVSQPVPRHREIKEPLARRIIRLLLDSMIDSSGGDN